MDNIVYCVISHTHWDREWYLPFEKFRIKLCDLINNLFKILEKYPDYIFHLDAQTVVLEDYLEIYPENEEKLKEYIKKGNIIVGPWYVQNDFYLSSGESTVRNLQIGTQIAEKFGKCAKVGYTPDQFGLCSQLPQIFKEFDIKYHLFGRGYTFFEKCESGMQEKKADINFIWQSPDGSTVKSTVMPFWYNNAQHISANTDKSLCKLDDLKEKFAERTKSPYLILMNGVDHLEAQDDLLPVLEQLNAQMTGSKIEQSIMEEVLKKNSTYAKKTVMGELRYGKEDFILSGTLSTRTDIKKLNYNAQNLIEHRIEPLYAMISLLGADIYPTNQIRHIWKKLIKNTAHDSICCCSTNNVMKHVKDRYLSIDEMGEELLFRGSRFINHHITRDLNEKGTYYLTVINTNQMPYTGVIECELNINIKDSQKDFKIYSPEGKEVEYVILNKGKTRFTTFTPGNLPAVSDVICYKVQIFVKNVPSFGYVNYTVKNGFDYEEHQDPCHVLENEYIKVDFEQNKVNLYDKTNNQYYRNILSFEDIGDAGDSYVFRPFKNDKAVGAVLDKMQILYANNLKSSVSLKYKLEVPESKDESSRAGNIVVNYIEAVLSLAKGEKGLSVDVKLSNNSKYHLTKAVINTEIDNTISYASSVYDVIRRDSKDVDLNIRTCYSQPNNGFVYKKDDDKGLAVYTKGIYEYENENNKLIKLSLLRSTDVILSDIGDLKIWGVKDNLLLNAVNLSFLILPFSDNDKSIPAMEQNFSIQPLYYFDSIDTKMFAIGRAAVQDSDFREVYFQKDEYENLELPHKKSCLTISNEVCASALKKAEKSKDIVLRVYNPSEVEVDNIVNLDNRKIAETNLSETIVLPFKNSIDKKKIKTLLITKG